MRILLSLLDLPAHDLRASIDQDKLYELADSLRDHGQLQPIGVKRKPDDRFEVVFGARRTRAAKILLWNEIEASILESVDSVIPEAQKLIENVQRLDMTPIEEAYGLMALIGEGEVNVRALQASTGKSREWVRTRLELLDLPEDLQGAVQAGVLGIGVARAFGSISNEIVREQYIKMAAENGCTAEQAVVWAGQAQYAETGILTMDDIAASGMQSDRPPQVVDQKYHCFICAELHSWRRINTLPVCGNCQEAIGASRQPASERTPPIPLDSDLLVV